MANKKNSAKSKAATIAAPVAAPAAAVSAPARAVPVSSTPVRNTPVPKAVVVPARKETIPAAAPVITHEMIARRAYEISQSGFGGSEDDNWYRAERELRGV